MGTFSQQGHCNCERGLQKRKVVRVCLHDLYNVCSSNGDFVSRYGCATLLHDKIASVCHVAVTERTTAKQQSSNVTLRL